MPALAAPETPTITRLPADPGAPALVLGCGAAVGAAWTTGALVAVREALGWEPATAPVIYGTSAGAELALMLSSGVTAEGLLGAQLGRAEADPFLSRHFASPPPKLPSLALPVPTALSLTRRALRRGRLGMDGLSGLLPRGRGDLGFLAELADYLDASGDPDPRLRMMAVDVHSGERVAFGRAGSPSVPARDAVRASWAVPGVFPPVRSGGRSYVDGGVRSPTSADLLLGEGVREAVIIAPMASRNPGRRRGAARLEQQLRRTMTAILDREVQALERAGISVLRIEPGAEDLAAMGPNLMDGARRMRALEASLRTSRRTLGARTTVAA